MAASDTRAGQQRVEAPPPGLPMPGRPGMGPSPTGKVERAQNARGTILRLWGYLSRQRGALVLTAVLVAATVGLNLLGPYLLSRAIDAYIAPRNLAGLAGLCLFMLAVNATTAGLTWLHGYIMAGASQRTIRDLRNDLFEHLQHLPLRFFDSRPHGDLMSRLTNDVENVNQVLTNSVAQIVSGILSTVGVAAAMFWINAPLAAASITLVSVLTVLLNRWVAGVTSAGFRQQQAKLGELNGFIEERIGGQRVVKAYGREAAALAEFDRANGELRAAATRAQIYAGYIGPLMNCVNNLGLLMVAGLGGVLAVRGMATIGTIAGFINYTRQFGRPLNEIANLYNSIQAAIAGAERVFAVIDEPWEVDAPRTTDSAPIRGEVVFEDVCFSYTEGVPILKGISLHAHSGEVVALVGPTGAGKTTIINLLTRFYEIDSGWITVDGRDLRDFPKEELRRQLGIVLQDTFLFAGTVGENIRYGRPDATQAEVENAARLANADTFIHRLPQGYETPLSERGGNLSQGQRQLLSIARALLADPRILILDEATSSVDTRTERHIQEAMLRLMEGRTSFVIAHRLSTIREADQILVMDQGRIIEHGTHTQLLAKGGFYSRLNAGTPVVEASGPLPAQSTVTR